MNAKQRRKRFRKGEMLEIGSRRHRAKFLWRREGDLYKFCGYVFRRKDFVRDRSHWDPQLGYHGASKVTYPGFELITNISHREYLGKHMIEFLSRYSIESWMEDEFLQLWDMVEYLESLPR